MSSEKKGSCAGCITRVPYATLIALIMCWAGVSAVPLVHWKKLSLFLWSTPMPLARAERRHGSTRIPAMPSLRDIANVGLKDVAISDDNKNSLLILISAEVGAIRSCWKQCSWSVCTVAYGTSRFLWSPLERVVLYVIAKVLQKFLKIFLLQLENRLISTGFWLLKYLLSLKTDVDVPTVSDRNQILRKEKK